VYADVAKHLFRITITRIESLEELLASMPQELRHQTMEQFGMPVPEAEESEPPQEVQITFHRETPKVGRNDLCPCGSGKKYKKCCGKEQ
jgi:preprotein translocase subunit SecA